MTISKTYWDIDGNEQSLYQMLKREPDWAVSRIQEGEKAISKLATCTELLENLLDDEIELWNIANNCGDDRVMDIYEKKINQINQIKALIHT